MSKKKVELEPDEVEEGEAWLASFADMMSLLLGFFMILYSMSHMDEKKFYEFGRSIAESIKVEQTETDKTDEELTETERKLRALQMMIAVLNLGSQDEAIGKIEDLVAKESENSEIKKKLAKVLKEQGKAGSQMVVTQSEDETLLRMIIPTSRFFKPGNTALVNEAKNQVEDISKTIKSLRFSGFIEITGHTDSMPPSGRAKFNDNWTLSAARAASVAKQMVSYGIKEKIIRIRGQGSTEPLFPEYDDKGRRLPRNMEKNRRIEIAIKRRL